MRHNDRYSQFVGEKYKTAAETIPRPLTSRRLWQQPVIISSREAPDGSGLLTANPGREGCGGARSARASSRKNSGLMNHGHQIRSYTPRSLRLTAPESIQRVMAAKISPERLLARPRKPRTSDALKRLGSFSSTTRQFIRPPRAAAPLDVETRPSPVIDTSCSS